MLIPQLLSTTFSSTVAICDHRVSMARGWESKSVEEQIELAAEKAASLKNKTEVNAADAAKKRELESLQLSRTRVIQDMASAVNPRYREQLQKSLDFLDEKLAKAAANSES
jgi:ribosomal protein S15P/S13E